MTVSTVEKIGGRTMSRFPDLIDSLFLVDGEPAYQRLFVVSAFGGITDLLLEHKHSGEPGVFSLFAEGDDADEWQDQLSDVGRRMAEINAGMFEDPALRHSADVFVEDRIEDARTMPHGCAADLQLRAL